jgi:hypothetical protein
MCTNSTKNVNNLASILTNKQNIENQLLFYFGQQSINLCYKIIWKAFR